MDKPTLKIAFVWFGIDGRYGHWNDGLRKAMQIIEQKHTVKYFEPSGNIEAFNPDVVLYWEAPCTIQSKDAQQYLRVRGLPYRKALLFAGGPLRREWVEGFDHVFVESKINADECVQLGIPHSTAFGINDTIFKPRRLKKIYDGMHHGTCAGWKRQHLVGEALLDKGLVVGRNQPSDPYPFKRCAEMGCTVMEEQVYEKIAELINRSHTVCQTSDYWGGGQRCTLEAMACNVPPVVMSDSPKNREYVEESGFGLVVDPDPAQIRDAVARLKSEPVGTKGSDYVKLKWTAQHYANSLLQWIEK